MPDLPDAADVLRALQGQFRHRSASVEAAMIAVLPFLEERDQEIERLKAACGETEEEGRTAILGEPPPGALL